MTAQLAVEGGFADPVFAAQANFRALMEALARPGTRQTLGGANPAVPLSPELGAVALTLCDQDTPVWLDPALAGSPAVAAWLAFHTGAPLTADPAAANFAFVSDVSALLPLAAFGQGTDEYPDRSTTLVLSTARVALRNVRLSGPGIRGELQTTLPLPGGDFLGQWAENRARFPRGIDLLLCGDSEVVGLPRTTRIAEAG